MYTWNDGRKFEGFWQNGKQHGKGVYYLPNKTYKIGYWKDGQL